MRRTLAVLSLGAMALAQPALDWRGAWGLALQHNPAYQNALLSREAARAELKALEADPTTLVQPLAQARQALALAELQVEASRLTLLQNLMSAYTALLEAQENERVLEANRALAERNLAVARARRQVGNATDLDVAKAEAALRSAELALENAKAQRPALLKALEGAMGISLAQEPRLSPLPEPKPLEPVLDALKEGLEERLPSLLQARQAVELAELQVSLADNDYTPRLTLEKARANLETARRSQANVRAQALATLESAYAQAQAAWSQVLTARETLANQERTLEVARRSFQAGTISQVQLQQEEVGYLQSRQGLLQAQNAYWRALAALSVAAGMDLTGLGVGP
ncbi:outer membrane efflux protein [Thermus thermophilus]|uniref:TolC family protein n=1 Tax=Thermus thermophilus TaxID=274 RepID=UPI00090C91AA|nr:TolC family protein [Thermus thermophilus]BAW00745.1 outer membrane efflux protein [Thermus thermophilus]BDB11452.1 transporter [Thermus thermophilus]